MAAKRSRAPHSGEAQRKATKVGAREGPWSDLNPPGEGTASSSLTEYQKRLLAGFGVLSRGHLQRCVRLANPETKCQDHLPAQPLNKEVTTSPASPSFIQPQPDTHSQNNDIKMFGGFDPSKYGAPPRKQRVAGPGPVQHGPVEPTASEIALLDLPSMTVNAQTSSSLAPSIVSEASNHAASFLTQATETTDPPKASELHVLKPKSANSFFIPGFDRSKYGMPKSRVSQSRAQDEARVKTDTGADRIRFQNSSPAANSATTLLPQKQDSAPSYTAPQLNKGSLVHTRIDSFPSQAAERDIKINNRDSAIAMATGTTSMTPNTHISPAFLHTPSLKQVAPSLPPPPKAVSKEERLKQEQHTALREIGSRNRHKGDGPETTSVRDLQIAREMALSESILGVTPALTSTTRAMSTDAALTQDTSHNVRPQTGSSVPKPSSTIPPTLPGISKEDRLEQAQKASLREIGMRNRGDGRDPETTSLVDLNLARTPMKYDTYNSTVALGPLAVVHTAEPAYPEQMPASTPTAQLGTPETRNSVAASGASNVSHKTTRNRKWCTNEELRPGPNLESNSNAWGSNISSNACVASSDSLAPMQLHGRLFKGPPAAEKDDVTALLGWDGKMQPPPVDWNDRPRFDNNSPAFKNGFNNWIDVAASECFELADRSFMFKTIPYHMVSNVEWHADGLAMTRRDFTLNAHNLSSYGYDIDPADVVKYAEEVTSEDYEDWAKLDMREADNAKFKDETTEQLVQNWLIHHEKSKKIISLAVMPGHKPTKESRASKPEVNLNEPLLNIYLRPAVKGDVGQLTDLYNWWVVNSEKTAEVRSIDISEMRLRFDVTKDDRLPFIVAILKGKKYIQRSYYTGVKNEQVVGFACATGFTAADYVEHIAAELEIYVHPKYLRQGIGRCLMDRLICATDRGHMERGGYPFHCDPAERHWYEVGGARDLHKLMFVARQYSRAMRDRPQEVEVTTWMKKSLVKDWDFEHEACLKQAGAKNGRFLDLTYFTKFSKWLPEDGRVPNPEPKDHKRH